MRTCVRCSFADVWLGYGCGCPGENDIAKLRAAETNYRAEQITHKKQERAHHDLTNDLAHRYGLKVLDL